MIEIIPLQKHTVLQLPGRVVKYVLIWRSSGTLTMVVDENEFELHANEVVTINRSRIIAGYEIARAARRCNNNTPTCWKK